MSPLFWIYISVLLLIVSIELYKSSSTTSNYNALNLFVKSMKRLLILPVATLHLPSKLPSSYTANYIEKNHRQILSDKFQTSFTKIINSDTFKQFIKYYGLNQFRFEILRDRHRNAAIDLCCLRLSDKGRSIPSLIVSLNEEDGMIRFIDEIDYAIKTGLSFVAVHVETDKLAFLCSAFDILDKPQLKCDKYSIAMTKRDEFMDEVYANEPIYQQLQKRKALKDIGYGEIIECAYGCSNPIFNGSKMPLLTAVGFMIYFMNWCGIDTVKQCISTFVHPKSIVAQKLRGIAINMGHPGIHSKISEYQINKSLLKKMKTDPWYNQNIGNSKLNKLLNKNYTMSCGVLTFEYHEDLIDIVERSLFQMKYIMLISLGYSKIKHIKSQISSYMYSKTN
eukprot:5820_1